MADGLIIRQGRDGDWPVIAENNIAMALESEGRTLSPQVIEAGVRAILADEARGRYFVAECDGRLAGQSMVTLEWSDWRNGWFWWLQSVYVVPAFRRRGVFRAIYVHIRELARARQDVRGLRLYVERENRIAIETYAALGMRDAGYAMLEEDWS